MINMKIHSTPIDLFQKNNGCLFILNVLSYISSTDLVETNYTSLDSRILGFKS